MRLRGRLFFLENEPESDEDVEKYEDDERETDAATDDRAARLFMSLSLTNR